MSEVTLKNATAKAHYYLENDGKSINVTDEQWDELLREVDEEYEEYRKGYLERLAENDYLIENPPIGYRYYRSAIAQKGYEYAWTLVDLDGNIVNAEVRDTNYGKVWKIDKGDKVEWVTISVASTLTKQQKFYNKKGYQLAQLLARVRPADKHSSNWLEFDFSDVIQKEIPFDEHPDE